MRSFAIILGCLAWVLSCFDAVSYYSAGTRQQAVEARLRSATADAASIGANAGRDSTRIGERLLRDQDAISRDQQVLIRDQKEKLGDAQDKQTLAADQAALQADRMMRYTVENFARTDPDPQVEAAVNRVDLDRRLRAETIATRERDLRLSHVLIALWALVAGTAWIAFRRRGPEPLADEIEEEGKADAESELSDAGDTDG